MKIYPSLRRALFGSSKFTHSGLAQNIALITKAKIKRKISVSLGVALSGVLLLSTQRGYSLDTSFGYEGQLIDNNSPATGLYDFSFSLFDASTGDNQIGTSITANAVPTTNGLFVVSLDFGPNIFTGSRYWLAVNVRTNGSITFVDLGRTVLSATPYALYAQNAGAATSVSPNSVTGANIQAATITGTNIANGQVVRSIDGLKDDVSLVAGANVSLSINGNTLQISAPAPGALTLPYAGTASSISSLFTLTNSGPGPSAAFFGNVGIGTISPAATLSIFNSTSDTIFKLEDRRADGSSSFLSKQSFYDYYSEAAYVGLRHNGGLSPTMRALVFGLSDANSGPASEKMRLTYDGKVGIGTTSPGGTLSLFNSTSDTIFKLEDRRADGSSSFLSKQSFYDYYSEAAYIGLRHNGGLAPTARAFVFGLSDANSGQPSEKMRITYDGKVGIGTITPAAPLDVFGKEGNVIVGHLTTNGTGAVAGGAVVGVYSPTGIYGALGWAVKSGGEIPSFNLYGVYGNGGPSGYAGYFDGNVTVNGVARVNVLTITGGSDVAEPFRMSTKDIPRGAVVIIDEENSGQLKLSLDAYDNRVAGIVSGAKGIKPGISLHQEGALDGGENVALSGRVYALADTAFGAIKPGDLLTTSSTPGHCMKVTDHTRAQGAVIGKAMSSLESGKGMVLVLVTLQ